MPLPFKTIFLLSVCSFSLKAHEMITMHLHQSGTSLNCIDAASADKGDICLEMQLPVDYDGSYTCSLNDINVLKCDAPGTCAEHGFFETDSPLQTNNKCFGLNFVRFPEEIFGTYRCVADDQDFQIFHLKKC